MKDNKTKKAVIFDLDGTLAESRQSLDSEMAGLLCSLLFSKKVAIISGGGMSQFQKQVTDKLDCKSNMKNLFLFPTKGAIMYTFDGKNWNKIYEEILSSEEKKKITEAAKQVLKEVDLLPEKTYGIQLQDRNTQFTFSALGENAPLEVKKNWDPDISKRKIFREKFAKYLPEFKVEIGGTTSIDITKAGIDKSYAIEQFSKYENMPMEDILFVGDALFEGGNDYPAKKTGVDIISTKNYNETKEIIRKLI